MAFCIREKHECNMSRVCFSVGMRSEAEIRKVSVWQLFQAAPESEVSAPDLNNES